MIIWHMANLSAGVSMVDSIVYYTWLNLVHSDFSMAGKLVSLIVIKDSLASAMIGSINFNSLLMIFYIIKVTNSYFVCCDTLS
jgi:hypothetical protein